MAKKWANLKQILNLNINNLPKTIQGLTHKAKKENWQRKRVDGVCGNLYEYYIGDMPLEIQKELNFNGDKKDEFKADNSADWVLMKDLIGVAGLPATVQGLTKKAKLENWQRKRVDGVKGRVYKYNLNDLPKDVQIILSLNKVQDEKLEFKADNSADWVLVKDLIGLDSLPKSVNAITLKAKKENWQRKRVGGSNAFKYKITDLPINAQLELGYLKKDNNNIYQNSEKSVAVVEDIIKDVLKIPFYDVQASCGFGRILFDDEYLSGYKLIENDYILTNQLNKDKLIFISASGDSMQPLIYANDLLLIDLNQITPINGQVFLIQHLDQIWIKKIQGIKGGYRLISENKNYDVIEFLNDELKDLKILGRVVQVTHDLN